MCIRDSGHNVFFRDGERVFRTYFTNNRGDEAMGTTWSYLDITPLGRQETWEDSPEGYPQTAPYKWWNWHDNYCLLYTSGIGPHQHEPKHERQTPPYVPRRFCTRPFRRIHR